MVRDNDVEVTVEEVKEILDVLGELARIHLVIDAPTRSIGADEPDWVCRLRKICLHVCAIKGLDIGVDTAHVMAPELRAAYVQMDVVWKCMPQEYKLDEVNSDWWADEARNGVLSTYDHPTPFSLAFLPAERGGFLGGDAQKLYMWLALWLGFLELGYGLALAYLAEYLNAEKGVVSRLREALAHESWRNDYRAQPREHGERSDDS